MIDPITGFPDKEEIDKAFAGTNFGLDPNYEELLAEGLLKMLCGYHNGYTIDKILVEIGFMARNKTKRIPTLVGQRWAYKKLKNRNW